MHPWLSQRQLPTDEVAGFAVKQPELARHTPLPYTDGGNHASEITTRGRSIIFLATGALTAEALGAPTLVVPENGFISLNVPLTPARR